MHPNMDRVLIYLLGILFCAYLSSSKPNGAPKDSCFYMTPRHIHPHTYRKVFPTKPMGLYNITTSADVFRPDRPIRVTLWGPPFKGFMMVAAEEGAKDWPAGIFYSEDGLAKRRDCLGRGDTVTHQNNSYKDSVSVLWYGPENMMSEQIQFIATVVVNLTIYYTNIRSGFVRLDPAIHGAPAAGNEGAPVAVTMDPWLAGNTVTQAPNNWWSQGGGSGGRGNGGNSLLSSLSSLSSLAGGSSFGRGSRTGGSKVWTEGTGSSWGNGGDWQQWGQGSLTSSNSGGSGGWGSKSPGSDGWGSSGSSWDSRGSGSSWGRDGSNWGGSSGGSGNSWGSSSGSSWDSGTGSWQTRGSGSNTRSGKSWGSNGSGTNNDWGSWNSSSGSGSSWSSGQDTWNTTPRNEGTGSAVVNISEPAKPSNGKKIWSWSSGKATTTERPAQTTAAGSAWGPSNSAGAGGLLGSLGSLGNLNFGNNAAAGNTGTGTQWSANAVLGLLRKFGGGAGTSNNNNNMGFWPTKK